MTQVPDKCDAPVWPQGAIPTALTPRIALEADTQCGMQNSRGEDLGAMAMQPSAVIAVAEANSSCWSARLIDPEGSPFHMAHFTGPVDPL